ncbi:MAG: MipA/OmpV family protein [Oleiphilaceae bacterium]|nr:MipA/OmpV family protein [Oleiphilaceae bacterium]
MHVLSKPGHLTGFCFFLFTLLTAPQQALSDELDDAIGVGYLLNSAVYAGQDAYGEVVPALSFEMGNFYGRGNVLGFYFSRFGRVGFSLEATMGTLELDTADIDNSQSDLYLAIGDREAAVEAGMAFHFWSQVGLIEFSWWRDVSDTHDAHRSRTKISRNIAETGDMRIVPGLFVNYYSAKYNRYYFTVTEQQNRDAAAESGNTYENFSAFRPEYQPGNSGHVGVDLLIEYPMSQHTLATFYYSWEDLTGPWETSPLVEDSTLSQFMIGISTRF